jgi:hypothetical protein
MTVAESRLVCCMWAGLEKNTKIKKCVWPKKKEEIMHVNEFEWIPSVIKK